MSVDRAGRGGNDGERGGGAGGVIGQWEEQLAPSDSGGQEIGWRVR